MVGLRPLPTGFFLAPEEAPRGQLFSDYKAYAGTSRPLPKERGWGDSAVLAPGVTTPRELRLGVSPASTLRFPRGAGGTTRAHLRPPASGPGPAGHRWDGVHGVSIPARSRGPGGGDLPTPALESRAAVWVTAVVRLGGPAVTRPAAPAAPSDPGSSLRPHPAHPRRPAVLRRLPLSHSRDSGLARGGRATQRLLGSSLPRVREPRLLIGF